MSTSAIEAGRSGRRSTFPAGTLVLIFLVLLGVVAAVIRYTQGLGAATNLSDRIPWGLWIGLDVMSGVALAAGGFTMAAIVYIFRLKRFYPLARPAILTAYIGYILAAGAILFDLGRPERFYHPFFYWNTHSVMFEIAWSVMTYLVILTIENSQWVAERLKWKWALALVRRLLIVVVVLGIIISTMHQSSLGGLFLLAPQRLHPLWYTAILPILFYLSAIMTGLAMVIIESSLSSSAFGRKPETPLLREIGKWLSYALAIYLVVNLGNVLVSGKFGRMFEGSTASLFYLAEILLGVVLPMALLFMPKFRQSRYWLFRSALLVVLGVVFNRFNVLFFGQGGVLYNPTWIEFAVSAGLISLGVLVYMFVAKNFPVLGQHAHEDH